MKQLHKIYDVVVVGGGHAGIEAALIAAKMGAKTLLLTINLDTIGLMPCNPAIGGIGKGQLVKEIDALGGEMGRAIDSAGIQFRTLNQTKGPAVRSSRAQADKQLYRLYMKGAVESAQNLDVKEGHAINLIVEDGVVKGVNTVLGQPYYGARTIITTGTFLKGKIHVGFENQSGGRTGEAASNQLSTSLKDLGLTLGRLKTGTPPRIDGKTIDFSKFERQEGDDPIPFSFFTDKIEQRQVPCYIGYTNEKTHEVIRGDLKYSPLYGGMIDGIGPRYCPSIEDKVVKFPDKIQHQIFLEPEGYDTTEYYPNGLSTSLPYETQLKYLRSIEGLEHVEIMRPGYAIEYDFVDPRELNHTLSCKKVPTLFCAGQINGTSGYEEAGAQGLVAGINAVLSIRGEEPFIPGRDEAYMGVMIDDLVIRGADEPYRMFTSRAEHRLILREDNAVFRLYRYSERFQTLKPNQIRLIKELEEQVIDLTAVLKEEQIRPTLDNMAFFETQSWGALRNMITLDRFLKRSGVELEDLDRFCSRDLINLDPKVKIQLTVNMKYEGYIQRAYDEIKRAKKVEHIEIPDQLNIENLESLTGEIKEKLKKHQPRTIGQAMRISGITPAAISVLMIAIRRLG